MRVTHYDSISSSGYDVRYREFRHRGIEETLATFLREPGGSLRALEVGAGTGHWLEFLGGGGAVVGLDVSENMLARARSRLPDAPLVRADATALPFVGEAFDRVVSVNAVHHFGDKPAFLRAARRVLRIGGALMSIGLDPHRRLDRWWIRDFFPETLDLDLERYSSTGWIRAEMARAGFSRCETREIEHIVDSTSADAARAAGLFDRSFTSQFAMLTEEELTRGLDRIAAQSAAMAARGETLMLRTDLRLYATTGWAG